jgi:hypothetical protein
MVDGVSSSVSEVHGTRDFLKELGVVLSSTERACTRCSVGP